MNIKGWYGDSAPHTLSKRLEVRFPSLVNEKNSVVSSLPFSTLIVEWMISLTGAGCGDTWKIKKKNYIILS